MRATRAADTQECLPLGTAEAVEIGLADAVLPGDRARFDAEVVAHARALPRTLACRTGWPRRPRSGQGGRAARPLETYRIRELAEMSHDIFDDRNGFAGGARRLRTKQRPGHPPAPRSATRQCESRPA